MTTQITDFQIEYQFFKKNDSMMYKTIFSSIDDVLGKLLNFAHFPCSKNICSL